MKKKRSERKRQILLSRIANTFYAQRKRLAVCAITSCAALSLSFLTSATASAQTLQEDYYKTAPEDDSSVKDTVQIDVDSPKIHLKTNAVGWGFLISNIAVEMDVAPHWSVALPVYYSAYDYFTRTVKFRTLSFYPEVRYWFRPDNKGWFGNLHLGLAWYNYAFDGDYRIQDHDGSSPTFGGGLGGGYRLSLGKSGRWSMELALGVGVYPLHYDKFRNGYNGKEVKTLKKTYFGPDQLAVSFLYSFDRKKKR